HRRRRPPSRGIFPHAHAGSSPGHGPAEKPFRILAERVGTDVPDALAGIPGRHRTHYALCPEGRRMNNMVPLKVTELHKSYGKKQVPSGLSLSAGPGTVTAILGSNGSGKSTFMRCLLGLHVFSQGRIEVMGEDVRKGPGYRRFLGYMPQLPSFPENLTVREIATLVERVRGVEPDFSRGRELGVGEFL